MTKLTAILALGLLMAMSCKTPGLSEYEEASKLYREGKQDEAVEAARRSLEENPAAAPSRWLIATIYEQKGQWRDAVEELQEILNIDPNFLPAGNRIGEILVRNGHRAEAKQFFEACLEAKEDYLPARVNLGVMAYEEGDPEAALFHLDRAVKTYPEVAMAHLQLANVLHFLGREEEAREQVHAALACEDIDETPGLRTKAQAFLDGNGP